MIDDRSGPKVGVLLPFTNCNLEPDLALLRPPGVTFHMARLGGYDADEIPGSDQMAGLGRTDMSEALRLISGVRPAAVLYGCTSATLTHGPAFDRDLAATIQASSGARSITAAGAVVAALRDLGATRIGFASPYVREVNDQAVVFLTSEGLEIVACADIGRDLGNYGQGELMPDEIFDLACRANGSDVQAVVLSCTDMRAVEVIDRVEAVVGKPVVTSNQAMVFTLCQTLGIPLPTGPFGRLYA
ncbi:MAG: Asp/Glu racemase [Rhodobacteraceae bacterium]|nr:Asp/Glu racemase [Paracoccaceae bacterium]